MTFEISIRSTKRLRAIDTCGMEEFENAKSLGPDCSHLQLLDPNRRLNTDQENKSSNEQVEKESNRLEAFDHFSTAQGELDVIIDLISNLEAGRHLEFRIMTNKPRNANAIQDLALESMARFGRRRSKLENISMKLRQGASGLRASADRDNAFFKAVVSLQRFWKIRLNPLLAEFSDSPFSVDLSLTEGSQKHELIHMGALNSSRSLGAHGLVPLVKDPSSGSLMVQEGGSEVALGACAVHGRLLDLQHQLLWRMAASTLEQEAQLGSMNSNFMYSLAEKTLAHIVGYGASLQLSSLRALILEHLTLCRLPNASLSDDPRPYVPQMSQLHLLPELGAWIRHIYFRDSFYCSLDGQAHILRRIRLRWLPTNNPFTSALQICLASDHRLILVMRESAAEIEGFPDPSGTASRWAREGHVKIANIDAGLLGSLLGLAY